MSNKEFGRLDLSGSRKNLLNAIASDAELQVELGARLHVDDEGEARKFMKMCPDYVPDAANFAMLKDYLARNYLSFRAENLRTAWLSLRARGRVVTQAIREAEADPRVSYQRIDAMSDSDVSAAMSAVVTARRKRRAEIDRALKGPMLAE